ncbi:MAG: transcription-repair coupling factor [Sinobacteraceae bacterium]|nr:transcription-repair coupling factor [Nevskiaceae bacterium]MCP5339649.1 transcription-repair coupling factor [Nevskiaceae bacterium]
MPDLFKPPIPDARRPLVRWHQLYGSSAALALAEAAAADTRPWLVVEPDSRSLERRRAELEFFAPPGLRLLSLPDWEVLPYDLFSPHPDIVSERLLTLAELPDWRRGILLVTADTLLQRLPPRHYVAGRSFTLAVGDTLALDAFRGRLIEAGYASVSQVDGPGEFALRGSLLDVFPMGTDTPLRIDLFDDQIEAIRRFDPQTQRSSATLQSVRLLPAREIPLDADAVRAFRRRWRQRFEGDPTRSPVYRGVSEGLAPPGVEFWLPLFHEQTSTLFDYLPADAVVADTADCSAALERGWDSVLQRYEDRRHDIERPLLPPAELFLAPDEVRNALGGFPRVEIASFKTESEQPGIIANFPTAAPREFRLDARAERPLAPLEAFLAEFPGRVLLAADSPGRREVLNDMLCSTGRRATAVDGWGGFIAATDHRLTLTVAPELAGLTVIEPPLAVLSESQLFGTRARQERRRRKVQADPAAILRDLQTLTAGAPVVHEEYGVGRYVGLQIMEVGGQPGEFLVLEYQDGDRLYVPVHSLQLVSRYTGAAPETAPLHKLGSDQWAKARRRAAEKVRDIAAELLDLYAQRKARQGLKLPLRELEYQAFANAFPFEETADQADAITRVLADLQSEQPMDRIVCGDVGFGKTEVAMRAAFATVQAGKQVAVLVPTTLLAQQHHTNFRDRFADWPVRIESLSRFRSGKETEAIVEGLERGTVDIVIATHRLLHANVRFKDLGLIIVDEEQRFGVRDKERLKALRAEVHVLTLTATPIPRTLNMALGGLRELSLIATPPAERLAIKTFVVEWNDATLREAVLRELRRGGQVYFVHNEIKDIEKLAADLTKLLPEAQIRIGHGQMRERELEQLMVDFYHRRFDVLLCTTIIESGIDVPSANTIIIDRADRFGLAQLHQLRGRVGRSHHRAYAYLIIPSRKALGADAARRLEALESLEDLGAGFVLATHDLEIRGAGELLGEGQSGEMTEVGLTMYLDMLDRAVKALKAGRKGVIDAPLAAQSEVEMRVPALLPDDYVGDVHVRLALYKQIASAPDEAGVDELVAELVDRFGELPEPAQNLLRSARLRIAARRLGVRRLDFGSHGGYLQFEAQNSIDPRAVIQLIQARHSPYRLEGPLKLRASVDLEDEAERFEFVADLLRRLAPTAAAAPPTPGTTR